MSIKEIQDSIIEDFSMLDGDMEMTLNYLIELGDKLPEMDEQEKSEENIVKGCQSKVWLSASKEGEGVAFKADSNTAITKGLVSLLVRVFTNQSPKAILETELYFPEKIGMHRFIGTQRSNGFASMMKQIKLYALAYNAQQTSIG
uniref:SufE family protein n=1 Tax=Fulvivirga sp. TaxID=1931237 RepID=UPI00404AAED2